MFGLDIFYFLQSYTYFNFSQHQLNEGGQQVDQNCYYFPGTNPSDKWADISSVVENCFLIVSFYGIRKTEVSW